MSCLPNFISIPRKRFNQTARNESIATDSVVACLGRWCKVQLAVCSCFLVCWWFWGDAVVLAQDQLGGAPGENGGASSIEMRDLPEPPAEMARLIERAKVRMVSGGSNPSSVSGTDPKLAAETQFNLRYSYQGRPQWTVSENGLSGSKVLLIRPQIRRLRLDVDHQIWFRKSPPIDRFWDDPLVQHEFDHVRLSSDPRLEKRFFQLIKNPVTLKIPIRVGQKVNAVFVREAVDQHVQKIFTEISDLVAIRYQELDRLTRHGLAPVPESFSQRYLSPDAPQR